MDTRFNITLIPHGTPTITYGLDNSKGETLQFTEPLELNFNLDLAEGEHKFFIDFKSKTNSTPEMAVEIGTVSVAGITTDRMKWAGVYYPDYPEPWASEQTTPLASSIDSATYLGWNGRWVLAFTVPVFTWVHRLENLGWIYSPDQQGQLSRTG